MAWRTSSPRCGAGYEASSGTAPGGASSPPTPIPTVTPLPTSSPTGGGGTSGAVNGQDDKFTTSSQAQGGGQGPIGSTVDGITCDATMSNNYHVHASSGST